MPPPKTETILSTLLEMRLAYQQLDWKWELQ